jgi:hypothetical protein
MTCKSTYRVEKDHSAVHDLEMLSHLSILRVLAGIGELWHQTHELVRSDLYHERDVLPGHMLGGYQ